MEWVEWVSDEGRALTCLGRTGALTGPTGQERDPGAPLPPSGVVYDIDIECDGHLRYTCVGCTD